MQIANPIYDVVFKYLLDDDRVAKLILSTITKLNIVDLEFKPTEHRSEVKETLTVFHLDFIAKVKDDNGLEYIIIIEIQKAKLPSDIMRFRRYLGEQYMSSKNATYDTLNDKIKTSAVPIISIYFLGHKLAYTKASVIKVQRDYINMIDGTKIVEKEEFIESLTHDSFIIQIPYLKSGRRNSLETILSLFDQENKGEDEHILNIKESDYPKKYHPIIRRLLRAIADSDIRKKMDIEDEIIRDFQTMERIIEDKKKEVEERTKEVEEKDKELDLKNKEVEEKNREVEEINREVAEKDKTIINSVVEFSKLGLSVEKIAEITKLFSKEIIEILK